MLKRKETEDQVEEVEKVSPDVSLRTEARDIVRRHRITFGVFKGKRCIFNDFNAPQQVIDVLSRAMKKGLI